MRGKPEEKGNSGEVIVLAGQQSIPDQTDRTSLHPAPQKPEEPLLAALRLYRQQRPVEAFNHLRRYDPSTRELLVMLLPLAARLAGEGMDQAAPRELSVLLEQLNELGKALRPRAALTVEKMCFSRKIDRYGVYDPLPLDHKFQAGPDGNPGDLVQVYVELRNFNSEMNGPYHETIWATSLEIRDYKHNIVWRQDRPARPDRTLSPRQDCFMNCTFYVPPKLPAGDYILWVQVKDMTGLAGKSVPPHRVARRSLDFHVTGSSYATR